MENKVYRGKLGEFKCPDGYCWDPSASYLLIIPEGYKEVGKIVIGNDETYIYKNKDNKRYMIISDNGCGLYCDDFKSLCDNIKFNFLSKLLYIKNGST